MLTTMWSPFEKLEPSSTLEQSYGLVLRTYSFNSMHSTSTIFEDPLRSPRRHSLNSTYLHLKVSRTPRGGPRRSTICLKLNIPGKAVASVLIDSHKSSPIDWYHSLIGYFRAHLITSDSTKVAASHTWLKKLIRHFHMGGAEFLTSSKPRNLCASHI